MEDCEVAFDNRFTRAFGTPRERIRNKVRDALREPIKVFIAESPFLVMATSDCQGRCDALPKGASSASSVSWMTSTSACDGLLRFREDGGKMLPHMRHLLPDFTSDRDASRLGAGGECPGIVKERFDRTHLDE